MDRNTIQKILIGLFLSACIFIGFKIYTVFNERRADAGAGAGANVSSSRMTYGRFPRIFRNGLGKTS